MQTTRPSWIRLPRRGEAAATWLGNKNNDGSYGKSKVPYTRAKPSARSALIGGAAKLRPRGRATRTTKARTEVRGSVHEGEAPSSIGARRGRGEAAATWPGNKNNEGSYGSQRTRTRGRGPQLDRRPSGARRSERHRNSDGNKNNDGPYGSQRIRTRGRNPQLDRRPSGARRSSGHVAGQQEQRWLVRKSEDPYTRAKPPARSAPLGGAAKRAPQ